ncbi:helix-turn-helix domain-containing protein [Streptomyces sp. ME19-01-6]|uniref:helix-turn-helix domain-containing protein n=1 Tax=Streptomyces sp. ME19-01-6 TaxID=3028686 RepID=UPI0029B16BBB|nr:pyridoxamine 5'-phosphate oxidase family protein [Streptomyces sp. ME19-01-6]MDX3233112.1 pyridoxamine 5'-phosphate oxidase family protein [Streptomyces sp. ME19-01-6]
MSDSARPAAPAARRPVRGGGDIGRRVALRRRELGLSREDVAARAGTAPGCLTYLEERPAAPGAGFLLRLAAALDTTAAELQGRGAGPGRETGHPALAELGPEECRGLLVTRGVGRISVSTSWGPAIVPVDYRVVDDAVVFRTAPDASPAAAAGSQVAFEVDHIDETLSGGWSVLVVGRARQITEPEAVRRLAGREYHRPWPGGSRDLWLRIDPTSVTGRRIRVR